MKWKGLLLVFLVCAGTVCTACGNQQAKKLALPVIESIKSVEITNQHQVTSQTDRDWIAQLLAAAEKAKQTNKESVQEVPNVENHIKIDFVTNNGIITVYCYKEDGKYYLEQPYQGIFQTDQAFYDGLVHVFLEDGL